MQFVKQSRWWASALAAILVAFMSSTAQAQQSNAPEGVQSPSPQARPDQRYTLKANDVLGLTSRFTPEFNQDVIVQPDGFGHMNKLASGVRLQGLTVQEATVEINKAYSAILSGPDITVTLKDFERPYFVVSGSVRNPGKIEYRGRYTVMEAVAMAGGFDPSAKHSQILLMRAYSKDLVKVTMIDVRDVEKRKDVHKDLEIEPGDTIYVPKRAFAKFEPFLPTSSMGMYQNDH